MSEVTTSFTPGVEEWLRSGRRGISSETIVEVMEKLPVGTLTGRWGWMHPRDPSDFMRCARLLEAVPAYRERLHEMSSVSLVWALLVARWNHLEWLLRQEEPSGSAPELYAEMQRLIKRGEAR